MRKLRLFLVLLVTLVVAGCETNQEQNQELTGLTIEGVSVLYVDRNEVVDLMEGITVLGSDGVDYSENIVLTSYTCGFYDDTFLHTEVSKKCDIIYTVVVGDYFAREHTTVHIR